MHACLCRYEYIHVLICVYVYVHYCLYFCIDICIYIYNEKFFEEGL